MVGFEEFVEAETPRLLGLAYALTGNTHDAWDLVQESLVRVGSRWGRLSQENPGGYVRTVLVRLNVDRVRRLRRERPTDQPPERVAPVYLVGEVDPWLLNALAALPARQRAAVVLRVFADLDHAAIADHLGCTVGTARSHLSRGLSAMRVTAEARAVVEET